MNRRLLPFRSASASVRAGILLCALGAASCTTSSEAPTIGTISVAGLSGAWRLELLQPASQGAILTPSSATYTLTLGDNTVSARADCNSCGGTFSLLGDSLTVNPLACTRAACPTMEFEALYTRILAGQSTVAISGSTMALVSSRGLLRFTR